MKSAPRGSLGRGFLRRLQEGIGCAWNALFTGQPQPGYAWVGWATAAGLYLSGIVFWGFFFQWGNFSMQFQDWAEVSAARLAFVRDALLKNQLPLHMVDSTALRGVTDRYLVLPDVITAPQMLLMRFMQVGPFVLVNLLILYTIGALGLWWLRNRFALSPAGFAFLFLAFNFNGQIQAHLSIGHYTWLGYYLFPWLLLLVFDFLEAPQGWRWVAQVAFLLFFMLLQGSYHQFIWSLMFLGLLGLAAWPRFWTVLKALVAAGLLSAVRLLPPVLGLGKFDTVFLSGFTQISDVWNAFLTRVNPADALQIHFSHHGLSWWEFDLYLGLAGTLIFLYFGGFSWLRNQWRERQYPQMLLPVAVLGLLSMGSLYKPLMSVPFPLLTAERASSRLIILPFVVIIVMAAINLQRWLDRTPRVFELRLGLLGLLAALALDLYRHARLWNIPAAAKELPFAAVNLAIKTVHNHADPPYLNLVAAGAALTLLTAGVLIFLAWRERRAAALLPLSPVTEK